MSNVVLLLKYSSWQVLGFFCKIFERKFGRIDPWIREFPLSYWLFLAKISYFSTSVLKDLLKRPSGIVRTSSALINGTAYRNNQAIQAKVKRSMTWTDGMTWFNPPVASRYEGDTLHVTTSDKGDFWRETFYGFNHDNGHALMAPAGAEFSVEVSFTADYEGQYDQAGLYLRADDSHWIKAGIEHVNGVAHLATVVTNGKSDWSQMPLPGFTGWLGLRLTRMGDAVWVQYRLESEWKMFRLAYFPPDLTVTTGPMACSPSRAGLQVQFRDFQLGQPISRQPY